MQLSGPSTSVHTGMEHWAHKAQLTNYVVHLCMFNIRDCSPAGSSVFLSCALLFDAPGLCLCKEGEREIEGKHPLNNRNDRALVQIISICRFRAVMNSLAYSFSMALEIRHVRAFINTHTHTYTLLYTRFFFLHRFSLTLLLTHIQQGKAWHALSHYGSQLLSPKKWAAWCQTARGKIKASLCHIHDLPVFSL